MRGKSGLALGLAVGYVLGTKAGRERYEQLSESAKRLAADPSLQRLQAELGGLFNASKQQATATIEGTAARAADKVEEAREGASGGTTAAGGSTTRARASRSSGGSTRSSSSSPPATGSSGSA